MLFLGFIIGFGLAVLISFIVASINILIEESR